jgi:mannan endo-1,4-beta-mannosidase
MDLNELDWIERAPNAPYFVTASGQSWTPIGQNDAITWPEMAGLFRRRDLESVERHLLHLRDCGVTCLRLMLEYGHTNHRYLERRVGMRILLTPLDTFFVWVRWAQHPYNVANGGPCADRTQMMVCPGARELIKGRLAFATERWGGSGVIFAWDLWNEMHPAQGNNEWDAFQRYIDDVSPFLRELETRLHGRPHLQCVSVFGPELIWKPWIVEPIFRHPLLDFANSHFYEEGTIDHPLDTVAPALSAARLTREALREISDLRPFFDSEHGPIHTFKDKHITLPEAFDDEYFRHIQWAHLASGGAGGGMRWPNRKPHVLTPGMRRAQKAMADFLPLVEWSSFRRRNLNDEITVHGGEVHAIGCGDEAQAVLWVLRPKLRPRVQGRRRVDDAGETAVSLLVPGLSAGRYRVVLWDTREGREAGRMEAAAEGDGLALSFTLQGADVAMAIARA